MEFLEQYIRLNVVYVENWRNNCFERWVVHFVKAIYILNQFESKAVLKQSQAWRKMEIYTQRLEAVTENCDFDVIELTFDTRQRAVFVQLLKMG